MPRRFLATLSAIVLTLGLAPALHAAPEPTQQALDWQLCGVELFCTWLTVPIDHERPEIGTLDLRVVRIPAQSSPSQGSLIINVGGPGAPGAQFTQTFAQSLPGEIRAVFDIVGLDTRGTGDSSPLRCVSDTFLSNYLRLDNTPTTAQAQRTWLAASARWSAGCLDDQPALAAHMQTTQIVRDHEALRTALGEPQLNFFGYSYGTVIGARYAQLFPDRVGRFILDGAVDPRLDAMQISRDQSDGFQRAIQRFASRCAQTSSCQLGNTRQAVLAKINKVLKDVAHTPLPAANGRSLVEAEALTGIVTAMYSPTLWQPLWSALAQANRGNGSKLQLLADLGNGRSGPREFPGNFLGPFLSTTCLDLPRPPRGTGLAKAAKTWEKNTQVPQISALLAWSNAPCTSWFKTGARPVAATSSTNAPILIIGTTFDPATPYHWSKALHQQLPTSSLLTLVGDGHTAFGSGSTCIDTSVTNYLLTGALPEKSRCLAG